ncbi:MAG: dienelactone hydrolase family protein [Pseudomonadales bacterium]|nr:dienelactone hydrolase family protein [Pseudomonadales bacterium]
MGHDMHFDRPDGGTCQAYLAEVPQARAAIIVIQEWWGLNQQIRSIADRFAQAGFTALAPDLYHGKQATDADEASHMMQNLDFPGATHQDLLGAVRYLKQKSGHVGVMGFCMGGALTIGAAVRLPEVDAAVCFYGVPPGEFADPADIKIPFQGHFANFDEWITPAIVDQLEQSMKQAGQHPEIFRYEAHHAFCNQTRPEVYQAGVAEEALKRTEIFFKQHLL